MVASLVNGTTGQVIDS